MGSEPRRSPRPERGSVMVLMPAGVLILLVLASLALDRALVFGEQRNLVSIAQAAANDAVAAGVDPDALRGDGRVELDPDRVARAIELVVAAEERDLTVDWSIQGESVLVHLEREVHYVLSPAVPGGRRTERIRANARAELRHRK